MSALRETGRSESSTRTLVIQDLEMGKKMREIILTQEEEQKKLARKKDKKAQKQLLNSVQKLVVTRLDKERLDRKLKEEEK